MQVNWFYLLGGAAVVALLAIGAIASPTFRDALGRAIGRTLRLFAGLVLATPRFIRRRPGLTIALVVVILVFVACPVGASFLWASQIRAIQARTPTPVAEGAAVVVEASKTPLAEVEIDTGGAPEATITGTPTGTPIVVSGGATATPPPVDGECDADNPGTASAPTCEFRADPKKLGRNRATFQVNLVNPLVDDLVRVIPDDELIAAWVVPANGGWDAKIDILDDLMMAVIGGNPPVEGDYVDLADPKNAGLLTTLGVRGVDVKSGEKLPQNLFMLHIVDSGGAKIIFEILTTKGSVLGLKVWAEDDWSDPMEKTIVLP